MSFPEMVWWMRSDLQNFAHDTTQHTATTNRITEGVGTEVRSHTHEQLSCRRQRSPIAIVYRFGERARITARPQTKCARSQSTTSPQICVTFWHFDHQPIIWHRDPRPRAHWYMCADVANYQNCHKRFHCRTISLAQCRRCLVQVQRAHIGLSLVVAGKGANAPLRTHVLLLVTLASVLHCLIVRLHLLYCVCC